MFKLDSEEMLLATFRPKDRKAVELATGMTFPRLVRHYLAWSHPAGGRVYVVFAVPGGVPTGIAFEGSSNGALVPHMCDWCHCTGSGTEIGMLTAYVNARKRVGVQVCSDLSCLQKLEEAADRAGASVLPAAEKLVARMGRFAAEALKIDLLGRER